MTERRIRPRLVALILPVLALTPAPRSPAAELGKPAPAWTLPWDDDWVTAVCFAGPNRLAAGNNLGQILVWDLPGTPGGKAPPPARRLDGHGNTVNRLIATPDGRWLFSASSDRTVRTWDMQAPAKRKDVVVLNARARDETAARKKKVPARVEIEVAVHEAARVLQGHRDWVLGLALSGDGKTLVSGDDKGEVIVWDRAAGTERRRWQVKGWAWALALAPDAKALLVSERVPLVFDSGRHAGLKLWDAEAGKVKHDLGKAFDKQFIAAAAFSPDGKHLAVGRGGEVDGPNGKVTLLDPATGKKVRELSPGHLYGVTDLAFHPDGKHLLSAGRDTLVRVWRVEDGKLLHELGKSRGGQFKDWLHAVAVSPDGRWLAAADMAGQVQVWALSGK